MQTERALRVMAEAYFAGSAQSPAMSRARRANHSSWRFCAESMRLPVSRAGGRRLRQRTDLRGPGFWVMVFVVGSLLTKHTASEVMADGTPQQG
jgi:hypothetical protein